MNDIADNLLSITRLFADDTSVACTASTVEDLEGILNHDLHFINSWSKQWLVKFNPNKTEVLYISAGNSRVPKLIFNDTILTTVQNHKHLGITLSNDGKWHDHIRNVMLSVSKLIGVLRKNKFSLSRKTLNQIYVSFIRPKFEYASEVWDNCGIGNANKLEQLQLEAARIITGLPIFTKSKII